MPKVRLTADVAAKARHTGAGNFTLYADERLRGFGLRVTANGAKAWTLDFLEDRNRRGPRRRVAFARYGDLMRNGRPDVERARKTAEGLLAGLVADGVDPREALLPDRGEELRHVARRYLADLLERAESGRGAKRSGYTTMKARLERHVIDAPIGRTRIGAVTREAVRRWHAEIGKGAPVEANRALTALSAVFGFGQAEGTVEDGVNPTRHVRRFDETGERRALTREELERLGKALADAERDGTVTVRRKVKGKERDVAVTVNPSAVLAIRLFALTGCRRSEILAPSMKDRRNGTDGLRWRDVDLAAGTVRLDTKTGAQTRVLGKAALGLLALAKQRQDPEDGDPVCPGTKRDPETHRRLPFVGVDKARRALWQAAEIPIERGVDVHSLRHSYATIGATLESGRYIGAVAALLGHRHAKAAGVTARYIDDNQQEPLREAADAIAADIAGLLGLELPDVTAIRGGE